MCNYVRLIGNVGQDVNVKYLNNGKPVVEFSLATNKKWMHNGQEMSKTTWHKVTCFNKNAEVAMKLKKGNFVEVIGELEYQSYTDKSGVQRNVIKIVGKADLYQKKGSRVNQNKKVEVNNDMPADDDYPF